MQKAEDVIREILLFRIAEEKQNLANRAAFRRRCFSPNCLWNSHQNSLAKLEGEYVAAVLSADSGTTVITERAFPAPGRRFHLKAEGSQFLVYRVEDACCNCGGKGDESCWVCGGTHWVTDYGIRNSAWCPGSERVSLNQRIPLHQAEALVREIILFHVAEEKQIQAKRTEYRKRYFTPDCLWDSRRFELGIRESEHIVSVTASGSGAAVITEYADLFLPGFLKLPLDPQPVLRWRYHVRLQATRFIVHLVEMGCFLCGGEGNADCVACRGKYWCAGAVRLEDN